MPHPSLRSPRPHLTGPLLAYVLADLFGLACVAIGGSWFVAGRGAIIAGFPGSAVEAVACTAGGIAVMLWAIGHIRRAMARPAPEMQARRDAHSALPDQAGSSPPRQASRRP